MDLGLQEKRVLITGALGGFGQALVRRFQEEGAVVFATGRKAQDAVADELQRIFAPIPEYRQLEYKTPDSLRAVVAEVAPDVLIANAGQTSPVPHASIGIGLFQAASLHVAVALRNCAYHEYQHSIFDKNLHLVTGDMACNDGYFQLPGGPGLGVEPTPEALRHAS